MYVYLQKILYLERNSENTRGVQLLSTITKNTQLAKYVLIQEVGTYITSFAKYVSAEIV